MERRAINRSGPAVFETGLVIITYPMNEGDDWVVTRIYNESTDKPNIPVAVHLLDVDRLIDQVKAQLEAMIADEEVPNFTIPDPKPELNPYSPASNFFRAWAKSESGRWTYVGLTEAETDELLELEGAAIEGDELVIITMDPPKNSDRYLELQDKHERARLSACGFEVDE